ncbi:MAG: hypothetical protein B7Y96_07180 [Comamonadaceae bacterium 32-67-11]|nr:MAG: hypothetical protein B7Y96_07180 [Comamonadaceae bacterium 32-67-11]
MIWLIALTVGITVAAGVYLALSRDLFRCVIGLGVLGSAINLLFLAAGRVSVMDPAVIPLGETVLRDASNPLPQALVLTAIVIGFALICFSLTLALRVIQSAQTDDALDLRMAEPLPTDPVKPPYNGSAHEPELPAAVATQGGSR